MPPPPSGRVRRRALIVLSALTLAVAGCSADGAEGAKGERSGAARPAAEGWTVLHYSMADTNLEPFMVEDLNEIGAVGSNANLRIRAFMDRSRVYGRDKVLDRGNWVGGRVLDIGQGGSTKVVDDLGNVDSADPETLAAFIADGIRTHPAAHYALIISDHGASWSGMGPDEGADGSVLDLAEITQGIGSGLKRAGVDRFDLLGFDACLMSSYEVASAMAPLADRMVASQELEPGHGWNYQALEVLADDAHASADDLGVALLQGYADQAKEAGTDDAITLGLVDLTKMDAVDEALADFSGALADRAATVAPVVGRVSAATLGFARSPDATQDSHLKDLGLLASTIGVEALDVSDQADALVRAINDAVVDEVDGLATKGATGLSIYFPPDADLADGAYLDVVSARPWADFLTAYYDAGAAIPEREQARFTNRGGEPEVEIDDDGVTLTGTFGELGSDNLTGATISYGFLEDDGSVTYFGEESAVLDPDGSPLAVGTYDLTALTISDGEDSGYAYLALDYEDGDDTVSLDVPLAYFAPDDVDGETYQDVLLSIVLDAESFDLVSETYYAHDTASGNYGELIAKPDGIIVPMVLDVDADGEETWEPATDTGLYADLDELELDFEPVPSGTELWMDLTVTDYGGNSSTLSTVVEVP